MKRKWVLTWAALRLPLFALVLYFFRFQITKIIEETIELWRMMDFAVYTASTASTRVLLYSGCALALGFGFWLTGKLARSNNVQYALFLSGTFAGVILLFASLFKTTDAMVRAGIATALLAANTMPHTWLSKRIEAGGILNLVFLAGVGVVEALIPQSYIYWLMDQGQAGKHIKKWSWLSGILIAPLLWMFLLVPFDNQRVLTLGERLHDSPSVEKFAEGDFNWIEFSPENDLLYAVGRSTNFLLAFETAHTTLPARRSQDIGKTQSFAFNPDRQELYAYKAETGELLYINALTLDVFRSIHVADLSPGDIWMNWNRATDTITIASEADVEVGTPFYLYDRRSGEVIATIPLPLIATNLAFHPEKRVLYFNSFKDTYLAVWDMQQQKVIQQVATSPRTDRLIFSETHNEIWVASPLEGVVLRYDADTLEPNGGIPATLGDRTLTIDPERNLLLLGNFINNRLTVIDLNTFEPVDSYYLGPWIRTIALDIKNGIAYVSTVRNIFKVKYANSDN